MHGRTWDTQDLAGIATTQWSRGVLPSPAARHKQPDKATKARFNLVAPVQPSGTACIALDDAIFADRFE